MKPPELDGVILGGVLAAADPRARVEASGHHETDFYDPRVRIIWGQIERLIQRRRPVDVMTVFSAARTSDTTLKDEDLGWLLGLRTTSILDDQSFLSVAEDHLKVIRGGRVAAHLEKLGRTVREKGLQPAALSGALESITRSLARDYVPDRTAAGDLVELIEDWDRRLKGEVVAGGMLNTPSGLKILDRALTGFAPSLNLIIGDPGIGKSGVAGSAIEAQLGAGMRVGIFGLEEGIRWLPRRLIAKGLGIPVSDVGTKARTADQELKLAEVSPGLHSALERLHAYSFESITCDELVRRIRAWILLHNVQIIYVDHLGEIEHAMPNPKMFFQKNEAVAHTCRRLRDLGKATGVPIVVLAHRTSDRQVRMRKGPPLASDVGLTGEAEKMARRMVGLWIVGQELRATVLKNNDGPAHPKPGTTVGFESLYEQALVAIDGGRIVNLQQEAREEREAKEANDEKKRRDLELERASWRDENKKKKAEAAAPSVITPAPAAPQGELKLEEPKP